MRDCAVEKLIPSSTSSMEKVDIAVIKLRQLSYKEYLMNILCMYVCMYVYLPVCENWHHYVEEVVVVVWHHYLEEVVVVGVVLVV